MSQNQNLKGWSMVVCEYEPKENKRKKEIIAAARKVFSAKGFKGATVAEITWEANLSPGSLYRYFKNKEELRTSLSINILEHFEIEIKKIRGYDLSVEEKMNRYCSLFIDVYVSDPNLLIDLFHLQSGETLHYLSDKLLQQLKEKSALAYGAVVKTIKEGIDADVFINEYPVALADIFWGSYAGVVLWVNSKHLFDEQKDFVKSTLTIAFEIILHGMKLK
ncbi:TetR/AcrR family transcriptional regulator [Desulfocicer niacini]